MFLASIYLILERNYSLIENIIGLHVFSLTRTVRSQAKIQLLFSLWEPEWRNRQVVMTKSCKTEKTWFVS